MSNTFDNNVIIFADLSPKSRLWDEELRKLKTQLDEKNIDQHRPPDRI